MRGTPPAAGSLRSDCSASTPSKPMPSRSTTMMAGRVPSVMKQLGLDAIGKPAKRAGGAVESVETGDSP
jgi:hypothetical protein